MTRRSSADRRAPRPRALEAAGAAAGAGARVRRARHRERRRARPLACARCRRSRRCAGSTTPRRRLVPTRSRSGERIVIVADYDADGATACAVGMRGLRAFGAQRRLHRARTASSTATASRRRSSRSRRALQPRLIVTVDNGIASVDGVRPRPRAASTCSSPIITCPAPRCRRPRIIVNPEPAGLRLREQAHRGRRRDVLRAVRHAREAARGGRVRDRGRSRISPRCSTSSRSAPSPTSCASTRPTACFVDAGARAHSRRQARIPASRAVRRRRARRAARDRVRPGLRRRAAAQRGGPAGRHGARHPLPARRLRRRGDGRSPPSSTRSTASGVRSRRRCRTRRWRDLGAVDGARATSARCACSGPSGTRASSASSPRGSRTASTGRRSSSRAASTGELRGSGRSIAGLPPARRARPRHQASARARSPSSAATRSPPDSRLREGALDALPRGVRGRPPASSSRRRSSRGPSTATARSARGELDLELARAAARTRCGARACRRPTFDDTFDVLGTGSSAASTPSSRSSATASGSRRSSSGMPSRCRRRLRAAFRPEVNEWQGTEALELTIEHWWPAP